MRIKSDHRLDVRICDSLEKIFHDQEPRSMNRNIPLVGYAGARTNVQVAVRVRRQDDVRLVAAPEVRVTCPEGVRARLHQVEQVPVTVPAPAGADPGEYLRREPGLYPDLLRPVAADPLLRPGEGLSGAERAGVGGSIDAVPDLWHALWVVLEIHEGVSTGQTEIGIDVSVNGEETVTETVPLLIVGESLPELDMVNTHWFHCDGLITWYALDLFSEQFWEVVENFLSAATGMSANSVLTPVWTPPLDTREGDTRLPTQLLGIYDPGDGQYSFDPTQLQRWINIAKRVGVRFLEMPHLFTQWGAHATPAIYVQTPGGTERRFGWDVPSTDPRYRHFLEQFLPYLIDYLDREWGIDRILFHVSDEPDERHLGSYASARAVIADLLADVTVVDALSSYEFYRRGLVAQPIVATDHAGPFLDDSTLPLWVYYCVSQKDRVSNRFIAQPSSRNRVLGLQLYLSRAKGFLHWGFNFYNSQLSVRPVNPFIETCGGGAFFGGDTFLVYPGTNGMPLTSIRYEVFAEAMNDHRAAQLLEQRVGREESCNLLRFSEHDGFELPVIEPDEIRERAYATARILADK